MSELEPLSGGRYELRGQLGLGGMATVYSAWDTMLHVERAIKILNPNLVKSPTIQQRFLNEARTMARLQHPNIVQVVDVGVDGSRTFMVMELLEGGSLQDRLERDGALPPHDAAHVAVAVLQALAVAHDAGIIHRDIKPQNILLTREGMPKLSDFGIAHVTDATRQLTKTGAVMGTIGFMAPEQRISARKVDGRADLYAVGTTLYAALTGQMPIELYASAFDEELMVGIPVPLVPVVQTSTMYKPEQRFADARTMETALRQAMTTIPGDTPAAVIPETPSGATVSFDDFDEAAPEPGAGLQVAASERTTAPPPWTGGAAATPEPPTSGTLDPALAEGPPAEPAPKKSRIPLIAGLVLLFSTGGVIAVAAGIYVAAMVTEPAPDPVADPDPADPDADPDPDPADPDPDPDADPAPVVATPRAAAAPTVAPEPEPEVIEEEPPEPEPVAYTEGFHPNALDGTWSGVCDGRSLTMDLNFMDNNVVGGKASLWLAAVEVNVPVSGTYRLDEHGNGRINLSGQRRISGAFTLNGHVQGETMSGTMLLGQNERGSWSAEKR